MDLRDKHIVVTGGAGGIGRALVRRFAEEGARAVVVADRQLEGASSWLRSSARERLRCEFDAGREGSVQELIATATDANGPIDIFISNAGIGGGGGGPEAPDEAWDEAWRINVMAHVWASRALLPQMRERGEGYLINTASAAGLLTQVSSLIYSVTKHAAVSLAEWLAIEYHDDGVPRVVHLPAGGAHADAGRRHAGGGRSGGAVRGRADRTGGRGGRGRGGDRRGALPDPPPRERRRVHGAQGLRPGTLDQGYAPPGEQRPLS